MAYLHDDVQDNGLQVITDATSKELHICSAEPTDRASAIANSLGNQTGQSVGAPEDGDTSGRKVVAAAVAAGSVTSDGTAAFWAIIDGTRLLAADDLAATQVVTSGNPFTLPAIDITIPDPA